MLQGHDIVVVGYARTPVGDFLGALKDVPLVELACCAGREALVRAGVTPEQVDEVAMGCIYKHGNKGNPARQVQMALGIPASAWAYTIDQQCASGMKTVDIICKSLSTGDCQVGLAVGGESMSRAPYLSLGARAGLRMGDSKLIDSLTHEGLFCAIENYHMGVTAENLAVEYGVSRQEQDELALLSHRRACAAIESGKFKKQIVPVKVKTRRGYVTVNTDEHPRKDISLENLSKLSPAFLKDGTVTAGNASGINDGAAALVLTTAKYAWENGLKPVAKILASCSYGVEPRIMGIGPAYAIPKAIARAGLSEKEIDYYEINEAFAAQFIAVNRVLKLDMEKVNANGSGISLGHPVGCTGVRIMIAAIDELMVRKATYGVASLCVGGGPAMAVALEML